MTASYNKKIIVPARIREARISRGYSLSELADLVGVSSQAISQYELGSSQPKMEVVMKLIQILNFPLSFFKKPKPLIDSNVANSAVYFRSMKTTPKKIKEAYKLRIEWADEVYSYLNKYVDFPEIDLPDFGDLITEEFDFETIEEITFKLREYWGIGNKPIRNLVEILQEKGFLICRIEFGSRKIDAFSQWYNGRPHIVLGSGKSAVRSRFDLAHELGHLIMHPNIDNKLIKSKEILTRIENEANHFAAALLLPTNAFEMEPISSAVDSLVMIKPKWKVSVSAMIARCKKLHIFSENQIRYLNQQMTERKWWRWEPYDDEIHFETPYLYKQAIKLLINNGICTAEDLLDEFAHNKEEIDSLCFLPSDLLNKISKISTLTLKPVH